MVFSLKQIKYSSCEWVLCHDLKKKQQKQRVIESIVIFMDSDYSD